LIDKVLQINTILSNEPSTVNLLRSA